MNPEHFLNKVQTAIEAIRPAPSGMYSLLLVDGEPKITVGDISRINSQVLAVLTSIDINEGLTPRAWNRIRDRFAIFQARGPK